MLYYVGSVIICQIKKENKEKTNKTFLLGITKSKLN